MEAISAISKITQRLKEKRIERENNLLKEAVTYGDMAGFLERTKNSPRIIRKDLSDILKEHPGDVGKSARKAAFYDERARSKWGPFALPKKTIKPFGMDKKYYNKVAFTNPEEVPHIYGDEIMKDKKALTAAKGAFLNHEFHELKAGRNPRTQNIYGHLNLPQVVGRADNNFVAAAADDATRAAADRLKEMRIGENVAMQMNDLDKFKAIQKAEGKKANPGFSRINRLARGESVPALKTEKSGFNFGDRKISRKEALIRYYKELGVNPNANREELKKKLNELHQTQIQSLKNERLNYDRELQELEKNMERERMQKMQQMSQNTLNRLKGSRQPQVQPTKQSFVSRALDKIRNRFNPGGQQ